MPDLPDSQAPIPLGQRLFDNILLWLVAGVAVMLIVYTAWGLWEVTHLPPATLP